MVCSPYSSGALICQRHVVGVPFLPGFASSRSGEFTNTLFEALSVLSGMAWRSAFGGVQRVALLGFPASYFRPVL
jgi:hypothetical protein